MATEPKFADIEVWVCVDEAGESAIGTDQELVAEHYQEEVGGSRATRLVKVTLRVECPRVTAVTATVPAGADGQVTVEVA